MRQATYGSVAVHFQHYDQASLLAGKLHAILHREYAKGRDWYDLWWYLSQPQWASPNFDMLNSALAQSGWDRGTVTADNWQAHVSERLEQLDWERVVDDVQRFLIKQQEVAELKKETIGILLAAKS